MVLQAAESETLLLHHWLRHAYHGGTQVKISKQLSLVYSKPIFDWKVERPPKYLGNTISTTIYNQYCSTNNNRVFEVLIQHGTGTYIKNCVAIPLASYDFS
jgi:hypothetical protein